MDISRVSGVSIPPSSGVSIPPSSGVLKN